jgi:thioredoxin 1
MMVLTDDNFETIVDSGGIVLVDFWASWCARCLQFEPVFEQSADENPDAVYATLNTDRSPMVTSDMRITSVPTLIAFRDGVLVFRQAGVLPESDLSQLVTGLRKLDMAARRNTIAGEAPAAALGVSTSSSGAAR